MSQQIPLSYIIAWQNWFLSISEEEFKMLKSIVAKYGRLESEWSARDMIIIYLRHFAKPTLSPAAMLEKHSELLISQRFKPLKVRSINRILEVYELTKSPALAMQERWDNGRAKRQRNFDYSKRNIDYAKREETRRRNQMMNRGTND